MNDAERIDVLFHSLLARFFAIPARQPALGATTFAQMRVLWILEGLGSGAPGALARILGIGGPAATELVDRLAERGFVRRAHSDHDRRRVVVTLRPKGRRLLAEMTKQRQVRFGKLLRVVGRKDVSKLAGALVAANEVVGKWRSEEA